MTVRHPVLVVLGEPGIDPEAAFSGDGVFSLRCYAAADGGAAPRALPADVVRLEATTLDGALREARGRAPQAPVLLAHAGERLAGKLPRAESDGPPRAGRAAGASSPLIPLDLSIRIAGKETRHSPWFGGRRAAWAPAPGAPHAAPALRATRDPGDFSAIVALLVRDAFADSAPRGRVGAARLLVGPLLATLRVLLAGAVRDGFRGVLVASLHGLHRLIVLARAWQEPASGAPGAAR